MIYKNDMAIHITDSGQFRSCRLRWHFSSMIRLALEPLAPPRALWLGIGVHKALEDYYAERDACPEAFENWAEKTITEIKASYPGLDEERLAQFEVDKELGIGMLTHYETYAEEHDNWKVVAVEEKVHIPDFVKLDVPMIVDTPPVDRVHSKVIDIKDPGTAKHETIHSVPLRGRGDMVVQNLETGDYWVIEHKTAAQITTDRLILEEQPTVYQHAMSVSLGVPIAGVMFNFLRKKVPVVPEVLKSGESLTKRKNIDTTHEVYLDAILRERFDPEDYQEILDILESKGNTFFYREAVVRSQAETANVMQRLQQVGYDMVHDPTIYPAPEPMKCGMCPFQAPCIALNDGSDWQGILEGRYQVRKGERPVGTQLKDHDGVL